MINPVQHVKYAIIDKSASACIEHRRHGVLQGGHMSEYSADERTLARFWAKVNKNGPVHPKLKTPCWLWVGARSSGYGSFGFSGRQWGAHRFAYFQVIGPVKDGLVLDHLCRNRLCCNPDHLEPVTDRTNILRGEGLTAQNKRKTHCKYGHLLSGENLYFLPHRPGGRECLACKRKLEKARWQRTLIKRGLH